MNSKERVLITLAHKEADRIPVWCGASPEFIEKAKIHIGLQSDEALFEYFGDDFRRVYTTYIGPDEHAPDQNLPDGADYKSPFGVPRHGYGYGQPMYHPLENASLEEVMAYPWPDPHWLSAKDIHEQAAKWQGEYAILGGDWSPFFHDAIDLLGMEGLLMGMYLKPDVVDYVMNKIVDYYYQVNKMIFDEASDVIDIFFLGNDLGAQNGPLFGGELMEKYVIKHIRRLSDLAKSYGLKVMMHSCGSISSLIDDLAMAGVDALQALQPDASNMDANYLKSTFGDRMVFNGCIDSHNVLIDGTPELATKYTKNIIEIMKPGGGFILSPSHDFLLEETPVENVIAMYEAAKAYGKYDVD